MPRHVTTLFLIQQKQPLRLASEAEKRWSSFSIIITYFYTYNLLKWFNPRKVPLLSSEILLFSRFLGKINRKNCEILIFGFYIICFVKVSACGCLSNISLVFEYLQVCQITKALKSSWRNALNVVVFQISDKIT